MYQYAVFIEECQCQGVIVLDALLDYSVHYKWMGTYSRILYVADDGT